MFQKAMLIYNGNAGQRDAEKILSQTAPILASKIPKLFLYQTQKPGDAEHFCRQHGEEVELVIVMGGDGTVHESINGLAPLDKRPVLAILPAGTCNDFARSLNIPLNLKQAAELIAFSGIEKEVDLVATDRRYFSNFWGTGLIANASESIDETSKGMFGRFSYYMSALRTLSEQDTFPFKLELDDRVVEEEGVMLLFMNGKSIGATEFPMESIQMDDGLLNVIVVKEAGFTLLKEIFTAKTSVDWEEDETTITQYKTSRCKVVLDEEKTIDLDGEHYKGQYDEIAVLKKHISVIVPKPEGAEE
ncbi:diacylglycerol/lipid kinase family protein [Jeotgalibacillus haloalkalitolerans]|uniref:Diacylglycerol kinase family protein n=1 Tax=Jeotgalibacillus haloalkalitolerans TaxID=3104292 RepID=A0ABU5KR24_9BACL|nr:diacylglycerol kinase family protein [Jeotgalibacillus sp. HH7-29]MDZ5713175.1 diacylglycerol kinase family protein [Jeotgalibacillus sp. HH7-29]